MTAGYLVDTDWVVRHFRGDTAYTKTIQRLENKRLAISIITLAELYEGIYRSRNPKAAEYALRTFLIDKTILPITEDIYQLFGQHRARLRKQNQLIGDFDLPIATTCLTHNLTLLTTNRRHFSRIPRLKIIAKPA